MFACILITSCLDSCRSLAFMKIILCKSKLWNLGLNKAPELGNPAFIVKRLPKTGRLISDSSFLLEFNMSLCVGVIILRVFLQASLTDYLHLCLSFHIFSTLFSIWKSEKFYHLIKFVHLKKFWVERRQGYTSVCIRLHTWVYQTRSQQLSHIFCLECFFCLVLIWGFLKLKYLFGCVGLGFCTWDLWPFIVACELLVSSCGI